MNTKEPLNCASERDEQIDMTSHGRTLALVAAALAVGYSVRLYMYQEIAMPQIRASEEQAQARVHETIARARAMSESRMQLDYHRIWKAVHEEEARIAEEERLSR